LRPSPVRTAALLAAHRSNAQKARALSRPRARLEWLGTASRTEIAATACQKSFWGGGRRGGPALYRWFQAEITATLGRGRPQEERWARYRTVPGWAHQIADAAWCRGWCAYEQSRNVLSFHGHYARDSTFNQGFRLRTGGGGSGSRSGCNDLATGSREAGAGGGEAGRGFVWNPPRGNWREQWLAPAAFRSHQPSPGKRVPLPDCCCHPTSRTRNARTDAGNHAKRRTPALPHVRESQA
jgi:hypothetical protein